MKETLPTSSLIAGIVAAVIVLLLPAVGFNPRFVPALGLVTMAGTTVVWALALMPKNPE